MSLTNREIKAQKLVDDFNKNHFKIDVNHLKTIKGFDERNQANDLSIVTRSNYLFALIKFSKFLGKKRFKQTTEKDIKDYLNSLNERSKKFSPFTIKLYKIVIKLFYRYLYNMPRGSYPKQVLWVETNLRLRHQKLEKKVFTDGDYTKLLKGCKTLRDRALISFLYNTGCRIGEALECRIENLVFDKKGRYVSVKLKGKTGEREIAMISGIADIQNYLKQHPTGDKKDKLFYANIGLHPIQFEGVLVVLKDLGDRVLKRNISAHLFRHSFATKLALKGYNESEMRVLLGWRKNSPMPSHYTWIKDKQVNKKRLIEAGLTEESLSKVKEEASKDIKCPRCKVMNTFDSDYCDNCFFALTSEGIKKTKEEDKLVFAKISKEAKEELYQEFFERAKVDLVKK